MGRERRARLLEADPLPANALLERRQREQIPQSLLFCISWLAQQQLIALQTDFLCTRVPGILSILDIIRINTILCLFSACKVFRLFNGFVSFHWPGSFPVGVWAHGDYCKINPKTGGVVMLGRRSALHFLTRAAEF